MPTPRTGSPMTRSSGHRLGTPTSARPAPARPGGPAGPGPATRESVGLRVATLLAVVFLAATGTVFWPASRASAAPGPGVPALPSLAGQCTTQEWQDPSHWNDCVGKLQNLTQDEVQCVEAPTPETPDSGMAGWFATDPTLRTFRALRGTTAATVMPATTTRPMTLVVFPPSCTPITSSRTPSRMASSCSPPPSSAHRMRCAKRRGVHRQCGDGPTRSSTRRQGLSTLRCSPSSALSRWRLSVSTCLWRSRQSDMSNAMTTAGWAILVMVAVTAIAAWPVRSAHLADALPRQGLDVVHSAVGPGIADNSPRSMQKPGPRRVRRPSTARCQGQ